MEARQEIERLLELNGADIDKPHRDKNHNVYQLSNGAKFVLPKTPSDWRSEMNSLSDLKRVIRESGGVMEKTENEAETSSLEAAETPAPPPAKSPMQQRIDSKIDELEAEKDAVKAKIQREEEIFKAKVKQEEEHLARIDSDLSKITKLMVLVDDPEMAEVLSLVLGPERKPRVVRKGPKHNYDKHVKTYHSGPPSHPQAISTGGQINKQLVLACTQTFDGDFTTRDVIERMVGGQNLPQSEISRVAANVSGVMRALHAERKVVLVRSGVGRTPSVWRKVDFTKLGNR